MHINLILVSINTLKIPPPQASPLLLLVATTSEEATGYNVVGIIQPPIILSLSSNPSWPWPWPSWSARGGGGAEKTTISSPHSQLGLFSCHRRHFLVLLCHRRPPRPMLVVVWKFCSTRHPNNGIT